MEPVVSQLQQRVREAAARGTPLAIRAGGTKAFYGNESSGEPLDPRSYAGIVSYEPTELVVTVRSGTSLAELQNTLASQRQMLPFEPPHFGAAATIGGAVAAGLAGPRRAAAGALRDFILGASLINGRGEVLNFGGRVMKNVAGYDAARTLAGSLGTLGIILDLSIKVLPVPLAEQTLRFEMDEAAAIRVANEWGGQPLPISGTAWSDQQLFVRLSGAAAGVRAAAAALGGEPVDTAPWLDLREHTHAFFAPHAAATLWRIAVPPTAPPLGLGPTLIEWSGGQRWIWSEETAAQIRARAEAVGGHATRFRGPGGDGAFHPLPAPLAAIQRRLKAQFDPAGIFNPGRLYSEF